MIARVTRPTVVLARTPYLRPVQTHNARARRVGVTFVQPYTSPHLSANASLVNVEHPRR